MSLTAEQIQRIAGFELNLLLASGALSSAYEQVPVPKQGTPIHDLNGEILFYRLPLIRSRKALGYADIARHEALGEPFLGTTMGGTWNENALKTEGASMARKIKPGIKFDTVRFVAYSYPKVALQFLLKGKEVIMLELYTWAVVPTYINPDRQPLGASNFERWSLIGDLPRAVLRSRALSFKARIDFWERREFDQLNPIVITKEAFKSIELAFSLYDTREIHYSKLNTDHEICFELRGQQTNVWCVAASTEMLLNFYRYDYSQVRLAKELNLGTLASPKGLPYGDEGDVVTAIEALTSNSLDATMHANPSWTLFRNELRANRPLISFIPGHSRAVAGYLAHTVLVPGGLPVLSKGLLVYDPWPPSTGVITRWENFATQTYRYAFTSVLKHI